MQPTDTTFDLELERFRTRLRLASDDQRRLTIIREFLGAEAYERPEVAIEYATEACRLAIALGDRLALADALRHRGLAHHRLEEVDIAVSDLREAHESITLYAARASDAAGAELATSIALTLGELATSAGDPATALHWYLSALDACEHCVNRSAKIKVFEALGHLYSGLGDYTRALEHHFESLSLHEPDADPDAIGVTLAAIGTTYALSGDYDEAYAYVTRALLAFRESGNRYLEVQALGNLSGILFSRGDLATALQYSLTAVTIYEDLGDHRHTAASLVNVGNINERQGDLDGALHCYLRAMRLLGDKVDERLHVSILASVGNVYRLTGAYNEALFMFEQALRISQEIDEPRFAYQLHESLSQVYEDLSLPAQALEHHKQFARLRNELAGQERQKAIAELQVRFEVERAAREREALRARAAELEAENERRQNELLSLALNLVQKDELLQTLQTQLQDLRGSSGNGSIGVVDRLLSEIDSNRASDVNWRVFEQQLEVLHPDLMRRLSERHPSLTQTELKVCSLAAVNLSNKDIASMLYMSVRTVETHRLNVRRKMELPKDSSLTAYLATLGHDGEAGDAEAST